MVSPLQSMLAAMARDGACARPGSCSAARVGSPSPPHEAGYKRRGDGVKRPPGRPARALRAQRGSGRSGSEMAAKVSALLDELRVRIRGAGLRVTAPRLAVLHCLSGATTPQSHGDLADR